MLLFSLHRVELDTAKPVNSSIMEFFFYSPFKRNISYKSTCLIGRLSKTELLFAVHSDSVSTGFTVLFSINLMKTDLHITKFCLESKNCPNNSSFTGFTA